MPTRYEKLTTRLQNHRWIAILLVVGTIVIAVSSFTDSAKNLIGLWPKPDAEAARLKLASLSVPFTPMEFVESAARGDLTLVRLFLDAGMDPNVVLEGGPTALFLAARENQPAIVETLLDAGAKVMNGESNGLEGAAQSGNLELVKRLLKAPATRTQLNAALIAAKNRPTLELLLAAGADLKTAGPEALFYANDPDAVAFLQKRGVDLIAKRADGSTFVEQLNLGSVNLDTLKRLIERGADLNARDQEGNSLLTGMVQHGVPQGVTMLLSHKVAVDQVNASGRTALSLACEPRSSRAHEIAELLLKQGASVSIKDQKGKSPLAYARESSDPELIQLLLRHGASD